MRQSVEVLKAIAATAELTGTELSEAALLVFEADLSDYSDEQVLAALTRCRRELRGRLSGLAMPTYVLDIPGAHGKVPAMAASVAADGAGYTVTDPSGAAHRYDDLCAPPG